MDLTCATEFYHGSVTACIPMLEEENYGMFRCEQCLLILLNNKYAGFVQFFSWACNENSFNFTHITELYIILLITLITQQLVYEYCEVSRPWSHKWI